MTLFDRMRKMPLRTRDGHCIIVRKPDGSELEFSRTEMAEVILRTVIQSGMRQKLSAQDIAYMIMDVLYGEEPDPQ